MSRQFKNFFGGNRMRKTDIKNKETKLGAKNWQTADNLGINDGNLSRKLRYKRSEEKRMHIRIINEELRLGVK